MKDEMIAMFHIGRGGQFHNAGHLTFVDFKPICEYYGYDKFFEEEEDVMDEDGNIVQPKGLYKENGNLLLDFEEWQDALLTGIGKFDLDGSYDTTYAKYVKDLDDNEIMVMIDANPYDLHSALVELGFTHEEIEVADYFSDWEWLLDARKYKDISERRFLDYYEILEVEPEECDYLVFKGKYYVKA